MEEKLVSIIVPTFNSEEHIARCLESIRNQTYKNLETIIVDDPLTKDNTRSICGKCAVKLIIQYAGVAASRNIGFENAKGDFIYHIDSDMELSPFVIEECVRIMNDENVHGIVVPEISIGNTFWAKCKAFEKRLILADPKLEAARFYRRSVFDKIGLYDASLEAAEDYDFDYRTKKAGFKISRCNFAVYHHEGNLTLWATMKKKYRYGETIKRYFAKYPEIARKQFFPIRAAYFRNWRMFVSSPIIGFGFIIMKICEYSAGLAAFIIKYK
jgi:glycosyltransferase involved in cell wall biosynthesis